MITPFLIIHTLAPQQMQAMALAQDLSLALACFDQPLKCLFIGNGVYQLVKGQTSVFAKRLLSYPLYDLTPIYVCAESLRVRKLVSDQLIVLPMQVREPQDFQRIIQSANTVLSF